MKKLMIVGLVMVTAIVVLAEQFDSPVLFRNDVRMDTGARQIDKAGTTLTATYAQLNAGLAAGISNNLFTNAVSTIVSNLTIGSSQLAYTKPYTTNILAGSATVTNSIVLDAKGLLVSLTHNP